MNKKVVFKAKKSLGQNFLVDEHAKSRICEIISFQKDDIAVEIGPGKGALSFMVLPLVSDYFAVELDDRLYQGMKNRVPTEFKEHIFHDDAASFSFDKCYSEKKPVIFGNLPYSHATPILINLCGFFPIVKKVVVMVQEEVGERICSPPGSKDYGSLSIAMQNVFRCETNMVFPPSCFRPRPKVHSSIITLLPREKAQILPKDQKDFFRMIKILFSERRKTIKKTLKKKLLPEISEAVKKKVFEENGIPETIRAEKLSVQELYKFYLAVEEVKKKPRLLHAEKLLEY